MAFDINVIKRVYSEMSEKINNTVFNKTTIKIINKVNAKVEDDVSKFKSLLRVAFLISEVTPKDNTSFTIAEEDTP